MNMLHDQHTREKSRTTVVNARSDRRCNAILYGRLRVRACKFENSCECVKTNMDTLWAAMLLKGTFRSTLRAAANPFRARCLAPYMRGIRHIFHTRIVPFGLTNAHSFSIPHNDVVGKHSREFPSSLLEIQTPEEVLPTEERARTGERRKSRSNIV